MKRSKLDDFVRSFWKLAREHDLIELTSRGKPHSYWISAERYNKMMAKRKKLRDELEKLRGRE